MATKKQKRAAAMAKREAFMAEIEASGLKALEEDRKRQEEEWARLVNEAQKFNPRHRDILKSAFVMGNRASG